MLAFLLITHVIVGLVGVGASYTVVMQLLRREMSLGWLRWSAVIALLSYVVSWLSGGYYYVVRYGSEVKPVILAGEYPWAHAIVTESKEHIFLFLPFLAFVTVLVALCCGEVLATDRALRRALIGVGIVTFALGIFIAIAGVMMSGAAR